MQPYIIKIRYTLIPVYGDIKIGSKEHKKEMIEKYTKAYEQEIPFNKTNNNYDKKEDFSKKELETRNSN